VSRAIVSVHNAPPTFKDRPTVLCGLFGSRVAILKRAFCDCHCFPPCGTGPRITFGAPAPVVWRYWPRSVVPHRALFTVDEGRAWYNPMRAANEER
jgi:hypothetical protein